MTGPKPHHVWSCHCGWSVERVSERSCKALALEHLSCRHGIWRTRITVDRLPMSTAEITEVVREAAPRARSWVDLVHAVHERGPKPREWSPDDPPDEDDRMPRAQPDPLDRAWKARVRAEIYGE